MTPPFKVGFFLIVTIEYIDITGEFSPRISARGFCARCGKEHATVLGYSLPHAKKLMRTMTDAGRIDFDVPEPDSDPRFSTDYLWGDARGQMFGVLVVRDEAGRAGLLKAFSGQYNGVWRVPGWVPPLVDADTLRSASHGVERFIKSLGRRMDGLPKDDPERTTLFRRRKAVSQALMKDIHAMYRIPNCTGEAVPLPEAVVGDNGIPAGTGDCCATKLLGYAFRNHLTPLGLAEFYFGRNNRSGSKRHGAVYSSCREKCARILGYMLCKEPCR